MQKAETIKKETISQAGNIPLVLPGDYKANNPAIIDRIHSDLSDWQSKYPHYLLIGSVGSGKTYLASLILESFKTRLCDLSQSLYSQCVKIDADNHREALNHNSLLRSYAQQLNEYISSIKMITARSLHRHYLDHDNKIPAIPKFFCLDDLGAEPDTQSAKELMISIISARYEAYKAAKSDLFIITTNLSSDDLSYRYGDRIVDRITEMCTIMKFKSHSFRQDRREIIEG